MAELEVNSLETYREIHNLIGGWFHQDFDLHGETVAEVAAAYAAVTPPLQQLQVVAEIAAFVAEGGDIESRFLATFHPDVTPASFAGSTEEFLSQIVSAINGRGL